MNTDQLDQLVAATEALDAGRLYLGPDLEINKMVMESWLAYQGIHSIRNAAEEYRDREALALCLAQLEEDTKAALQLGRPPVESDITPIRLKVEETFSLSDTVGLMGLMVTHVTPYIYLEAALKSLKKSLN